MARQVPCEPLPASVLFALLDSLKVFDIAESKVEFVGRCDVALTNLGYLATPREEDVADAATVGE